MEAVMKREWQNQDDRNGEEMRRKVAMNAEAMKILNERMEVVEDVKLKAKEKADMEMEQMRQRWRDQEQEAKRREEDARERNIKASREVMIYNETRKADRLTARRMEREEEARLIEQSLMRDREQEDRARESREKQQAEARAYRAQVEAIAKLRKQNDDDRDAVIKAAGDAEWAKRDTMSMREAEAKACVMKELYQCRQQQVQEKELSRRKLQEEKETERELRDHELHLFDEVQKRKAEEKAKVMADLQEDIVAQIQQKRAEKLSLKEASTRDFHHSHAAEGESVSHEKDFAAKYTPEPSFGRKKSPWYT